MLSTEAEASMEEGEEEEEEEEEEGPSPIKLNATSKQTNETTHLDESDLFVTLFTGSDVDEDGSVDEFDRKLMDHATANKSQSIKPVTKPNPQNESHDHNEKSNEKDVTNNEKGTVQQGQSKHIEDIEEIVELKKKRKKKKKKTRPREPLSQCICENKEDDNDVVDQVNKFMDFIENIPANFDWKTVYDQIGGL